MCNPRDNWGFGPGFPFGGRRWAGAWTSGSGSAAPVTDVRIGRGQVRDPPPAQGKAPARLRSHQGSGGEAGRLLHPFGRHRLPTLQLLEDEGYVRADETEGKKVYHITPEGERYLEEHRDLLDEILDRVRETVRGFTEGGIGELQGAFVHLAGVTFRRAWRRGPEDPALQRVAEILRKAADEIEEAWSGGPRGSEAAGQ